MEKNVKRLKIITIVLIVIILAVLAFGGLYFKKNNVWENVIPDLKYGMELSGKRELKFVLDDSEEEKNYYIDSDGNILGEVLNSESTDTDQSDATKTAENTDETQSTNSAESTDTNQEETTSGNSDKINYATEVRTVKHNPDEIRTNKNFEKAKKIIKDRLNNAGIREYNIRLDSVSGEMIVEVPDDNNVDIVKSSITTIGKFEIIDEETGIILISQDDIKDVQAGVYDTDGEYQVCIQFFFTKEGSEKLKDISNKYRQVTNDAGETTTSHVKLTLDGENLMTTYFGEELSNGVLQMPYGNASSDTSELNSILIEARRMAEIINEDNLPIDYELENDNLVKSNIDMIKNISLIVMVFTAIAFSVVFIIKYHAKGFLYSFTSFGYIALLVLILKYVSADTPVTINSLIAMLLMIVLEYIFARKLLKENKENAFFEVAKKYYLMIIPAIVVAVVFTFVSNLTVASIGIVFFWGLIMQILYNLVLFVLGIF